MKEDCRLPIAHCPLEERDSIGASAIQIGNWQSAIGNTLRRLHADRAGALATEYLLIMALIVLPLALLTPMFLNMTRVYASRMIFLMGLPFP